MAMITIATLESESSAVKFEVFHDKIIESASNTGVEEPVLPRRIKIPPKLADSFAAIPEYTDTKEIYRVFYDKAFEIIINHVKDRFMQKGYKMVMTLEISY